MPWLKVFDLVPGWLYALVVGILLLGNGWFYVQKSRADMKLATFQAEVAEKTRQAEAAARLKERQMQNAADRIAKDAQKRQQELVANAATTQLVADSLRDEIARLNARPASQNPDLAACTGEARAARELLGACSERYRGVAQAADGLRDQVTGLQEFVLSISQPN